MAISEVIFSAISKFGSHVYNEMAISYDYLPSHSVNQILMFCLLKHMHSRLCLQVCVLHLVKKKMVSRCQVYAPRYENNLGRAIIC